MTAGTLADSVFKWKSTTFYAALTNISLSVGSFTGIDKDFTGVILLLYRSLTIIFPGFKVSVSN